LRRLPPPGFRFLFYFASSTARRLALSSGRTASSNWLRASGSSPKSARTRSLGKDWISCRFMPSFSAKPPTNPITEFYNTEHLLEVAAQVPPSVTVTLLADREYGSLEMTRWCLSHGWHFCLRLKKNRWFLGTEGQGTEGQRTKRQRKQIASLPLAPGGRLFLADIRLPSLPDQHLSLCCGWSRDNKDDEPWYILSDLPADHQVLALYHVRFHIEEMFRDFKEFGFRLETTHLRDAERVSRLLLCVCLAHVWLMNAGVWVSKRGLRRQVDRHKKRQLSYFQIGWRFLQKLLACGLPLRCEMAVYI